LRYNGPGGGLWIGKTSLEAKSSDDRDPRGIEEKRLISKEKAD
jgi:hypothetical protein